MMTATRMRMSQAFYRPYKHRVRMNEADWQGEESRETQNDEMKDKNPKACTTSEEVTRT